jgi:hypothetical protein
MKLIEHATPIRVPGIRELFEYYMTKSQKALINIAFDQEKTQELQIEELEEANPEHNLQYDTHNQSRAVEPPRNPDDQH